MVRVYKTAIINKIKAKSVLLDSVSWLAYVDAEKDSEGATGTLMNYLSILGQKGV